MRAKTFFSAFVLTVMLLQSCSGICRYCLKHYTSPVTAPDTVRIFKTDTLHMERVVTITVPGDTVRQYLSLPDIGLSSTIYNTDSSMAMTIARVDSNRLYVAAMAGPTTVQEVVRWDTIVQWRDSVVCPPQLMIDDPPAHGDWIERLPGKLLWFMIILSFVGGLLFRQLVLKFPLR